MPADTNTSSIAALKLSLSGSWRFALDRDDRGIAEKWFEKSLPGDDVISLPGSMLDNNKGDDITLQTKWVGRIRDTSYYELDKYKPYRQAGMIKVPFFLTPEKHYVGTAWYQREIDIPQEWPNKLVHLHLERPHWTTQVWVDGTEVGFGEALSTLHVHHLGKLSPGRYLLTVRVDNKMYVDVGEDAHSITDQTQTNWNGIVGDISLNATAATFIDEIQIYPARDNKSVLVWTTISGADNGMHCRIGFRIINEEGQEIGSAEIEWQGTGDCDIRLESTVPVNGDVTPWDEFHSTLYLLMSELSVAGEISDTRTDRFGFRHFEARGTKFYLNNRHIYLRGTHEGCTFPNTGYPPTDKTAWTRIFRIIKEHGLNHMRFHSWCPPKAAFEAADEEGIILSAECASWTIVGFDERYDTWLFREADRILREYGNHPSFCMMLYGNEPYGFRSSFFLAGFVEHYKARDRRRLFSAGTAWPLIPENEFQVWANARIQYWDENLDSRINAKPPETTTDYTSYVNQYPQPIISHEIGQWCVYPNFEEIAKFKGRLRPGNWEIFRDFLDASGMGDQAAEFLMASGMLQVLCYKEEIESALRTPGFGGFHLLDLHDYTGQGTALIGMLDVFWDPKPYVSAEEIRRFCAPVVPLARLEKRVFTSNETVSAEVLISQFGAQAVPAGELKWTLARQTDSPGPAYAGSLKLDALAQGELHNIGNFSQELSGETVANKLVLEIELTGAEARNDWEIWVYPEKLDVAPPAGVHIASRLDDETLGRLRSGGKVLLMPDVEQVLGDERGQVPPGFSTIFYNTAWTRGQKPHTMGILCDPAHPALAYFPTDYHSNWQWWYIVQRARTMILNPLPMEVKPIVQVIDDWFTVRRLAMVFECELEGGKLLVSSIDVKDGGEGDPVCRQMLYSLLQYVGSQAFNPQAKLSPEDLRRVVDV